MIYFTSDLHLGHDKLLKYRPEFESVEEMDACIIDAINSRVKPSDELYVLGDFAWKPAVYGHYRARLNVRSLHMIRGNHDRGSLVNFCSTFEPMLVRKFQVAGWDNRLKVHMCHYPVLSWNGMYKGSVHLYGHGHGCYEEHLNRFYPGRWSMDVGVDAIHALTGERRPIDLEEVIYLLGVYYRNERVDPSFRSPG